MSTKGIAHHQWRYGQRQAAVPISAHEETRHLREQDAAFIQHSESDEMIRKILAAFGHPWFLESKRGSFDIRPLKETPSWLIERNPNLKLRMSEDQIKRRLASIRDLKASLREDIGKARKQKKARKTLYAEMAELTNEEHRLEGMMK